MGRLEFEKFLDEYDQITIEESNTDWNLRKRKWLEQIDKLYQMVETWLEKYEKQGKIAIGRIPCTINEDILGCYEADELHVRLERSEVTLRPVAMILLGAAGRVDMEGRAGKVRMVLVDKKAEDFLYVPGQDVGSLLQTEKDVNEIELTWKIVSSPPDIEYIDLNEESFFDALMEVINA